MRKRRTPGMKVVLPKINFTEVLRIVSVTYTAVLPIAEATVEFVAGLLDTERQRRGTRWRKLTCFDQAVLVLRWFVDGTRLKQLACDNDIGKTTAYAYLHETIDMLAEQAPDLHNALLAAKVAGHEHLGVDGTLIYTDRIREPGPTLKNGKPVDLWWSGKHRHHGGNIQVVTAPDGWPLWTSDVRPGREHDLTALRTHPGILPALETWIGEETRRRRTDQRAEDLEQGAQQQTRPRRTRKLPAEDHLQGVTANQPLPLPDRRDRRRRTRLTPRRTRPHNLTTTTHRYPERLSVLPTLSRAFVMSHDRRAHLPDNLCLVRREGRFGFERPQSRSQGLQLSCGPHGETACCHEATHVLLAQCEPPVKQVGKASVIGQLGHRGVRADIRASMFA